LKSGQTQKDVFHSKKLCMTIIKMYTSLTKKKNAEKTPAPQNFWPYSFQFYKSNPIKTFSCLVKNANSAPTVKIEYYVRPSIDRNSLSSELMPSVILNKKEFIYLIKHSSEKLIKEI
jgi:hypothetical protein